jgi:undecaprenyl-diphosphatase
MTYVTAFDGLIIGFLSQFAQRDPAFDRLVVDIADSALLKGGLFMGYFWWLWFKTDNDTLARRQAILTSIAGAVAAVAISRILQRLLPYHDRPLHAAGLGFVLPAGVNPDTLNDWNSFPSDHAALFFALSTAIWYQSRPLGYVAGLWTLFVICLPRIYLGYHYPSDILGGAVLGVGVMVAAVIWGRVAPWPGRVVRWSVAHQTAFYCIAFLATYEITVLFYDLRALAQDSLGILKSVMVAAA